MCPTSPASRQRLLSQLAAGCVLLMLVVTTASAWLRLAQSRPGCEEWPHCRLAAEAGLVAAPAAPAATTGLLAATRGTHRGAASAVLLLVLALLALAAMPPREPAAIAHGLALLALALALAALGIAAPRSRAAAVLLGNLGGGLLMLALAWRLQRLLRRLRAPAAQPPTPRVLAALTAACWLAQAGTGLASGAGLGSAAAQVHLALALAGLPLALVTGWVAQRRGRRAEGIALMVAAAAQLLLGAASAVSAAAPPWVLLHNAVAAVGIALAAGLTIRPDANRTWSS